MDSIRRIILILLLLATPGMDMPRAEEPLNLSFRDTPINEVYEMLSRQARANIVLGSGVTGNISMNLYDVSVDEAIYTVARGAGYAVEHVGNTYYVIAREEFGQEDGGSGRIVRTLRVQYTDTSLAEEVLKQHLSRFGRLTAVPQRNMLVVEDRPAVVGRIEKTLAQIDVPPRQILIEARILEITLDADQTYGIDWNLREKEWVLGARGLAPTALSGLFVNLVTTDIEATLNALRSKGRVRTLSTPRLLVLEDADAEVIIGDRLGFRVTTTINQVTTETVQFIESGVILKVGASIDRLGRVLLKIHPEVSTGTINDGVPSVATTEVTTQMLAKHGQRILIGGLIRKADRIERSGVPVLSDVPLLGGLFSQTSESTINTETVVLITPYIVDPDSNQVFVQNEARVREHDEALSLKADNVLRTLPRSYLEDDTIDEVLRDAGISGQSKIVSPGWPFSNAAVPDGR
ncbi:MAG: hypothetical protein KDK91_19410 [Gammaproteobacteria bacterium]|nr:hypothetical protein [Gammaproteobacteria bacterium]